MDPPPRAMPTKSGKRIPGQVFPPRKNSSYHAHNFTYVAKPTQRENSVFLNSRYVLCQRRQGRENPAKFFLRGKTLPSTPSAPEIRLHFKSVPLMHLVPQHDPTRDRDRPRLTRWSRGSLSWACWLPSCCCSPSYGFRIVRLRS